ncbi:MAG: leucine dehydrogenase [Gammaproteobacteria bacterium GWE2_42_36]|nr:MAG: leucine dehydrogenase [Gammaproteobacteria bacterium GWE2_42_36]HCU05215.1 leucine dehydrogenase [Coxiellaceae bacterium]
MNDQGIFELIDATGHEKVVYCHDKPSGLKAIIAIHNTALGPALGGCRMYPYKNERDAVVDALRLSRGMTYKAAVAGLNLGGGKSVIIGDPKEIASEALFRAFGRFINGLGGRYITAEDVGTSPKFMTWIREETENVVGIPAYLGGSGDPSPVTAHGVFMGLKAAVKKRLGKDSLKGIKVAVEGIGNVGYHLCKELHEAGAQLIVADINPEATARVAKEFGATVVQGEDIYKADADVYAPCALGATVNDKTISMLKCTVIAGAANNQLKDESKHSAELENRKILYAPDYVINAGGLINVYSEIAGGGAENAWALTSDIYNTLLRIFDIAEKEKITTAAAAAHMAEKRIADVGRLKSIYSER